MSSYTGDTIQRTMGPVAGSGSGSGSRDLRSVMAACPHGTEARYGAGCRCEDCRAAHAERMRRYRARRRGEDPFPGSRPRYRERGYPDPTWDLPPPEEGAGGSPAPAAVLAVLASLAAGFLVVLARRSRRPAPPVPRGGAGSREDGGAGERGSAAVGRVAGTLLACGHRVPVDPSWRGHASWCPECGSAVRIVKGEG